MTIKKITIILGLFLALSLSSGIYAQQADNLPSPGITPDSPLYFLDTWGEKIDLALTKNKEAKTEKQINISQEKLAEAKAMAEKGNVKAAEIASNRYGEMVNGAAEAVAQAAQSGEGFAESLGELLATTTAISQEVLAGVYEQVPEEAKSAIQKAMQVSSEGMQKGIDAVNVGKREEVQQKVNENLQRARDMIPEEAKENIPMDNLMPGESDDFPPGQGEEPGQPESPEVEMEEKQPEQDIPSEEGMPEDEEGGSAPIDVPGAGGGGRP